MAAHFYKRWIIGWLLVVVGFPAVGLAQGLGFSDIHNSSLYPFFPQRDRCGQQADSAICRHLQTLSQQDNALIILSIGFTFSDMVAASPPQAADVLSFFRWFKEYARTHFPALEWVQDSAGMERGRGAGRVPVAFGLEGACILDDQPLEYLDLLHAEGLCVVSLAHWLHNRFVVARDSSERYLPINDHSRLSPTGKMLLERLIALGIWIDVSHLREGVFWEVVALNANRTPLIASHSNAASVYAHPRNLDNRQLDAIAASGGLVGICLHRSILGNKQVNAATVVRHIRHIGRRIGYGNLCWGSDYGGNISLPDGLETIEDIQTQIPPLLRRKGLSASQIKGIFSDNLLRLWRKRTPSKPIF